MSSVNLEAGWLQHLGAEFEQPYMQQLKTFLKERKKAGAVVYPESEDCFNAFNYTPFDQVKVVILGQDPYHGPGQAHGLSFSVKPGVAIPPSLRNIYKELEHDLHIRPVKHGYLESWAKQGVLLLNSVLTVEQGQAAAHQGKGWETFTDRAVQALSQHRDGLVFLLWGSHAQKKGKQVDRNRHLVLETTHPSPLSAHRGFLGCRHFSTLNQYLMQRGLDPIQWQLPD
ncbi:uracil-DNA glycosylase [Litoribrevibacter albus]|uniref:uracil-DNA glycosylase n=1 Tax=Litoribrevibacter albus TaxID=1473156 RepID=UPI0024E0C0B2|nr:uracil-DNA glycosylase [Litoribrevibacter albus]